MSVRVTTSIWGTAWERYGEKFAKSFTKYWDPKIELSVTVDKKLPFARAQQINLHELDDYNTFHKKWKTDPKKPLGNKLFKYDAPKWTPQAITPKSALNANPHWVDGDILIWTDADTEFYDYVDEAWVEKTLNGREAATLQRKGQHSEIGYFAIRLNEKTRKAMHRYGDLFPSYDIFKFPEWHSAYAWDIAIREMKVKVHNLNTSGRKGHVFPNSMLAEKIVHNKGDRKGNYEGTI